MSGIEINVNADDVQKAVVQALMDSTVGETIKSQIQDHFTGYKANEFWRKVVADELKRVVNIAVRKEVESHADEIQNLVSEQIDEEAITKLCGQITNKLWD